MAIKNVAQTRAKRRSLWMVHDRHDAISQRPTSGWPDQFCDRFAYSD